MVLRKRESRSPPVFFKTLIIHLMGVFFDIYPKQYQPKVARQTTYFSRFIQTTRGPPDINSKLKCHYLEWKGEYTCSQEVNIKVPPLTLGWYPPNKIHEQVWSPIFRHYILNIIGAWYEIGDQWPIDGILRVSFKWWSGYCNHISSILSLIKKWWMKFDLFIIYVDPIFRAFSLR